jgi:hypothetical protein
VSSINSWKEKKKSLFIPIDIVNKCQCIKWNYFYFLKQYLKLYFIHKSLVARLITNQLKVLRCK